MHVNETVSFLPVPFSTTTLPEFWTFSISSFDADELEHELNIRTISKGINK
jgi:hypothetical protein